MKMERIVVQVPGSLKAKLDATRKQGTTTAGLIRCLLRRFFKGKKAA